MILRSTGLWKTGSGSISILIANIPLRLCGVPSRGNELADHHANLTTAEDEKLEIPTPYSCVKFKIEKNVMNDWQETWDGYDSESGRGTRDLVPKVNRKCLMFSKYLIFILSGHGPFPYYLSRFKKLNSSLRPCDSIEDVDHYVFRYQYTKYFHLKEPILAHWQAWFKNLQENMECLWKLRNSCEISRHLCNQMIQD
ncbi:hypothetical protein AVEN_187957-1 [Araneus ventricosus]|uniref:Uncharacterized protein n=1 Tax=Araneus ventricosus TaxID=182803 RepID=A0A4Y2E0V2_ARAVE|nr:hypothetical protein AVEN_187957-1 [Araneus ventricosus]